MQEIIVYRNPMEAALWSTIMSGDFFPVIVGVVVFFLVFLGVNRILNKGRVLGKTVARNTKIALGLGALAGFASQPVIAKQPLDGTEEHAKLMAEVAYRYADAMMKARKEPL